jgi:hypothetical protein
MDHDRLLDRKDAAWYFARLPNRAGDVSQAGVHRGRADL